MARINRPPIAVAEGLGSWTSARMEADADPSMDVTSGAPSPLNRIVLW